MLASGDSGASLALLVPLAIGAAAAAYALVVGALSLRTRGVYFIMVTLAFAQMAYFVFHDTKLGGGSDGIFLYAKPVLALGGRTLVDLGDHAHLYYAVLAALVATYAFIALLLALALRPRAGRHPRQRAAHARGGLLDLRRTSSPRSSSPARSPASPALLLAVKDGTVNPELLAWHESGAVLLMLIFGGIGSLRGAVIGAVAFTLLKELFQSEALLGPLAAHWQLTLGLAIIAFVALLPRGLIGLGARLRDGFARGDAAGIAEPAVA